MNLRLVIKFLVFHNHHAARACRAAQNLDTLGFSFVESGHFS